MDNKYTKWVAAWGTATSIADQTLNRYAKDITLRYSVFICFSGSHLRFRFSNLTGTEPISFEAYAAKSLSMKRIDSDTSKQITMGGSRKITIEAGCEIESDPLEFDVQAGERISVSMYISDCTQMNAGTLVTGPYSKGFYSFGDHAKLESLPRDLRRTTNWVFFLNTVDVLTEEKNHALICYGDSITAQSWPDYLTMRAWEEGYRNVSVIRRAVCGTRILRQYDCSTYAAYGLKGETRFPIESNAAGADRIIIQHGINDIIHPVGTEVNVFRPWSDLPSLDDLIEGYTKLYIDPAKKAGMTVWGGTLLPIWNWRTYAGFREVLKNNFNEWLRTNKLLDGCIDFDVTVRDEKQPERFKDGYDSGDHLHPSEAAYKAMAYAVPKELLL